MKKKLLSVAMLAAMGAAGSANAVHVNPDGLGQVLIYPYYTVEGGFDTYVNVVNTTADAKAVKVRFLEGKNSQEVLDFNLYLSPYDVWTGAIVRTTNGAMLTTSDASCTAPAIPAGGVEFRNYQYIADSINALSRTREGYIEIIEMGVLTNDADGNAATPDNWATYATHVAGVPANCAALRTAANPGGLLNTGATVGDVILPTGGLYGFNTLINVNRGIDTMVDAVAMDNFFADGFDPLNDLHAPPGDMNPSLNDVNTVARIFNGGDLIEFTATTAGIDDLSAVIAHDAIMNDYMTVPGIQGMTDWVVTFPTKRFYVNPGTTDDVTPATTPFSWLWNRLASRSCETISISYWNREEGSLTAGDDDFSPRPPGTTSSLCNEVNTVAFNAAGTDSVFAAATENTRYDLSLTYDAGWARMTFTGTPATTTGLPGNVDLNLTGPVLGGIRGLPVVGFSAMSISNNTLVVDGVNVMSNYVGHSVHKGTRVTY